MGKLLLWLVFFGVPVCLIVKAMFKIRIRYFLISYNYKTENGISIGDLLFSHRTFPSRKYVEEIIFQGNRKFKNPNITSIYEFKNKDDFNAFNNKEKGDQS